MIAVFRDPDSGEIIELSDAVVELFMTYSQAGKHDKERGGLLFANPIFSDRIVIDAATQPHPRDQATRCSLSLDHGRCADEIRRANNEGRWFVGYWHTHPDGQTQISHADISAFSKNLAAGGHGLTAMLAVIVGKAARSVRLSTYLIRSGRVTCLSPMLKSAIDQNEP